jgi:hypothetical protein
MIELGQGPLKDFSLRDAMRHVLCETETDLETDPGGFGKLLEGNWLENRLRDFKSDKWKQFLEEKDIRVAMSSRLTGKPRLSIMSPRGALVVPVKGNFDLVMIETLFEGDKAFLDQKLALAGALIDFPTSHFSKKRCDLTAEIPDTPLHGLDKASATKTVLEALEKSSSPTAKEFLDLVSELASNQFYIQRTINKLNDTCEANPKSVYNRLEDYYHLLQGRVANFRKLPIAEPFAMEMFYESDKLNAGEFDKFIGATINEKCELVVKN